MRIDAKDSGETYVELLVTLVIVGLVAVAIMGGLLTSTKASIEHRNLSQDDAVAKTSLESATSQIELTTSPLFKDCSATLNASLLLAYYQSKVVITPPTGYSVSVTGVECWNPTLSSPTGSFDTSCSATSSGTNISGCGAGDNSGLIRLTVSAVDPSGFVVNLSTLIRDPQYSSGYSSVY